uniref:Uncharacterized protein n=1 Tax=Anguilla anguilla TaxID=7936 RepID=A0A0E9WQQ3_ANGAN
MVIQLHLSVCVCVISCVKQLALLTVGLPCLSRTRGESHSKVVMPLQPTL